MTRRQSQRAQVGPRQQCLAGAQATAPETPRGEELLPHGRCELGLLDTTQEAVVVEQLPVKVLRRLPEHLRGVKPCEIRETIRDAGKRNKETNLRRNMGRTQFTEIRCD